MGSEQSRKQKKKGKMTQKEKLERNTTILLICLILFGVYFLYLAYGYYDAKKYNVDDFPVYSGTLKQGNKLIAEKGDDRLLIDIDNREFVVPSFVSAEFYDEVRTGDTVTVSYLPKKLLMSSRLWDGVMSIEKDGKQYLDTESCMRVLYENGRFSIIVGPLCILLGGGLLFRRKLKTAKESSQ